MNSYDGALDLSKILGSIDELRKDVRSEFAEVKRIIEKAEDKVNSTDKELVKLQTRYEHIVDDLQEEKDANRDFAIKQSAINGRIGKFDIKQAWPYLLLSAGGAGGTAGALDLIKKIIGG